MRREKATFTESEFWQDSFFFQVKGLRDRHWVALGAAELSITKIITKNLSRDKWWKVGSQANEIQELS